MICKLTDLNKTDNSSNAFGNYCSSCTLIVFDTELSTSTQHTLNKFTES